MAMACVFGVEFGVWLDGDGVCVQHMDQRQDISFFFMATLATLLTCRGITDQEIVYKTWEGMHPKDWVIRVPFTTKACATELQER